MPCGGGSTPPPPPNISNKKTKELNHEAQAVSAQKGKCAESA